MNIINRKAFIILIIIIGLSGCLNKKSNNKIFNIENEDQGFLDKYKIIGGLEYAQVTYEECKRIKNQKTRDMVKNIYLWPSFEFNASELSAFNNLEKLTGEIHADSFKEFSIFKKLKWLVIKDGGGESYNFIDLIELTELENINMYIEHDYEIDFSGIENLKKLNTLIIRGKYRSKNIDCISNLTELEELRLCLDNGNIDFLKNMTGLKRLMLSNFYDRDMYIGVTPIINKYYYLPVDLHVINGLKQLEVIDLYGLVIYNIETINELHNLKYAEILNCYLNPNNDYDVISKRINLLHRYEDIDHPK